MTTRQRAHYAFIQTSIKTIHIAMIFYRQDGNKLMEVLMDDNSYRFREIMGDNTLTLYFSLSGHMEIPLGAYVDYQGERYTLQRPEALKMNHTRNFEYTVTLESDQAKAKIWKFRCLYSKEKQALTDGRLKFSLTAKPKEHLQMFVDNMNRRDTGWTVGECIDDAEKCISYDHVYCWAALGQMADEFNTEFEIVGKRVSLHKVEYNKDTPLPLSYGRGKGFKPGVGRSNYEDNPPIEILYTQGGTDNIDRSKYGSSELHLPKNGTVAYDGVKFEDEEGFDASNAHTYIADDMGLSVYRLDGTRTSLAEDSLDCSSVYPQRVGTISEVICVDKDNNFYDFTDGSIPDTLNYGDCLIEGETMTVIFQSGMLAGKEFDVKYYHAKKDAKKGRRFEIVPQEIDGQTMPNDTFKPVQGDKYAVFNCYLPEAYINAYKKQGDPKTGAEWDMMRQAVKYLYDNEVQNFSFTGTLDGIFARKNWLDISGKIRLGGFILFSDDRFQKEGVRIRIISIKDYINTPYSPEITLSNSTVTGSFTNTIQQITSSEVIAEEQHREALQFTKRRFRDAKETLSMIEQALLDNFTNSITPITVQTMAMLVGDESLQFRFVNSMTTPQPVEFAISYDQANKKLHCPSGIIQHMTLGIDAVSPDHKASEYRFWTMEEYTSGRLDDTEAKYYLYAKVSKNSDKNTGSYYLSATAIKMDSSSDTANYYLLIGILNSEYDGERSFASLYGFTEVLPGRITTDRIVSSEGNSYFDLVGNAMKLGDAFDFNSAGDGLLRLKGTIVQSQSGDSNYIGCYRGIFNPNLTYYQGDEVTYGIGDCVSTYRYVYPTPASGVLPTDTEHWQVIAKGSEGKQGISPNTAFKSTVFLRSNAAPSTPTGGSYSNPVPSGWSDGIPSGEAKLWASTRIFSSDGKTPQQSAWTAPRQMTDTADFDVVFSSEDNPASPTGHPNTNAQWGDKSGDDTIWMATSRKSNGVWEDWQASRIKGENGRDGSSISIKGQAYAHYADAGDWVADREQRVVLIDKMTSTSADGEAETKYCIIKEYGRPRPGAAYGWMTLQAATGDAYIMVSDDESMNGCLYVAQADGWLNVGQIKGDKGDTGDDGKSAYLHIKYAKSLVENDWSDNSGETPAEYIGVYADNNPADQLVWSLYSWSKWQGEDGFGYEYIYKRTSSATAPSTPAGQSQEDGFVPDGWTDDPAGVSATYMYEWVCYRKKTLGAWGAFIGSASDNSKAALWAKYGQAGAKGDYTEMRFAKNGSTTAPPALDGNSAAPDGWTTATPSVGIGEYLWMTTAKKSAAGALLTTWSTPVRVSGIDGMKGDKGEDGSSPAMVYRGEYSVSKTYYGNTFRLDCVRLGNAYYIARIDAGEFAGIAPPDSTRWNAFGASFDSVATQLLLAQYANIGNFVIKDNCIISQKGTVKGAASTDYENPDFVPSILLDGQNGQSVISGSLRSPCVRYDGAFYFGGDVSSEAERYDNLVLSVPQDEWELNLNLPWTEKCNGRRITIINYKWGSETPNGTYTFTAPDGKYFYEDGALGKTLKISREVVELLGYGDNETFFGWIVTGRGSIGTERKYGKAIKALAYGTVTGTSSGASINYKTYDGKESMGVSRMETGRYKITFPGDWFGEAGDVFVMATGVGDSYGEDAPIKATLAERSTSYIMVETSDDASRNDGTFMFLLMNSNDWL